MRDAVSENSGLNYSGSLFNTTFDVHFNLSFIVLLEKLLSSKGIYL